MKKALSILFAVLFVIVLQAQEESNNTNVSTYYLIRHAEKVKSEDPNPVLHPDGELRAKRWAEIFKNIKFDAIYSTDYIRTRNTAAPTAKSQGVDVVLYDPKGIDYKKFLAETKGKTVLIVGHSNTIPYFVNNLIGKEKYQDIEYTNNGNLYIVEINNCTVSDKVLYLK